MKNIYLTGSTIRFQCTFNDFNNQKIDPQLIKLLLYNEKFVKVNEFILNSLNKLDTGVYFYDYITSESDNYKKFYYEFYGEIGGKPSINRGEFSLRFIL